MCDSLSSPDFVTPLCCPSEVPSTCSAPSHGLHFLPVLDITSHCAPAAQNELQARAPACSAPPAPVLTQ